MSATKLFLNGVKLLHEAIEKGDIKKVKSLLSKLPVDKHYFDANDNSAAAVAIKLKKNEIYELLVSKGIFLGPDEMMDEATFGQERSLKINLREIHKKYFNDPNLKHLINLITSTKLSHEALPIDRREHLRLITEAFEDLNGLKSIEPILKVASTSQKLKIIFDFNRDSVEFLDPVQDRNVMGICYTIDGIIYLGAKGLKDKDNRCDVLGHLIHELTHFVMKLIYDNEAKPYQHGNQEKSDEFSQVVNITAAKKDSEPYIKIVYDYPDKHHHAELIVRVPHLTALYKDDADKTSEVQMEFLELFDFYEENTLVDLKQEFALMEVKHEIRELNELCGSLSILGESEIEMSSQSLDGLDLNLLSNEKILFISSNCPQLTLSAILQQVCTDSNFETSFIFADLKSIENTKFFDLAVKALALSTHPRMIIDCQGDVKIDALKKIVEKLKKKAIKQKVIFILSESFEALSDVNVFEILHSWSHLTSDFQQKLLQKKVEFQGTEMVIKELLNDLSSIESIPFQDLLNDQTIVIGKNHKFETEKLIERKFLPSNSVYKDAGDYTIEHDLNELITFAEEHQTILITDEPGMGKSTSLEMLYLKLRKKKTSLWLVFIDLKENFEAYQKSCLKVNNREKIAKFLNEKILKIESFEAQVFTQLFNEDRVVLLMDGLDEICPSYKQFIFSLMKDIQKFSKNRLWISTRPHLTDELTKELNPIVFTLKPFTEANRREFFEKHFSGDQNSELKLNEIERFLEKLKPNFGLTNEVCNPLIMRMIVEILDEDQNSKLSEANLFDIYDSFTRKMIEKCLDRGQEAKKYIVILASNSNFVEFYQQQAFLTCFGDRNIKAYENSGERRAMREKLIDPQFAHVCRPSLDEIVRVGLMYASSSENLNFIHRTFAEFYVAKYFYEVIFKSTNPRPEKYLNQTIEFLLEFVLNEQRYKFIIILIENALDGEKLTVKKFPPSTLQVMQDKIKRMHFETLVEGGFYNLIEFIVLHLHPDSQTLLFSNDSCNNLLLTAIKYRSVDFIKRFFDLLKDLNADEFKKIIFVQDRRKRNIFFQAASNPNSEVFKFIDNFCESLITKEELNELLMHRCEIDTNVLHCAVQFNSKVDIIIEILTQKLSLSQQKTLLEELDYFNNNLLQSAVKSENSVENFESLIALMKKVLNPKDIEKFLLHEDSDGCNAFDFALMSRNELVFGVIKNFYLDVFGGEKMREIMFTRNNCENSIQEIGSAHFFWLCLDGVFKRFFLFAKELSAADSFQKEFFQIKYEDGEIFLMFAVMKLRKCNFATVCSLFETNSRVEILQQKNVRGECAFHWAVERNDLEIFLKVRKLYEESFDKQNLRIIIVSCDKSWICDLIKINMYDNSETFNELFHYLKKLFKGTEESEMLKAFFLFADKTGQTAFMVAAGSVTLKKFENLLALTKELYTIETVKQFLLLQDAVGATAFNYSLEIGLDYSFAFVKSVFEELFEREKLQEMVLFSLGIRNILSVSINLSSRLDSFEILCNYLIKLFDSEPHKLKNTFVSFDYSDETLLMKAAKNSNYNYIKALIEVIEKLFVKEKVVEMLCQRNQEGKTTFHFSIGNKEEEIFETVKDFYIKTLRNEAMKNIISFEVDWTSVFKNYNFVCHVKRLVPLIKSLFVEVEVPIRNIFFKPFEAKAIREARKSRWEFSPEIKASIISYLEEQFPDDDQIKMLIIELESNCQKGAHKCVVS